MFTKIFSFFLSIITFFAGIFGFETTEIQNHVYHNLAYGTHERHTLDLYIPKAKDEVGLVLFIHGGAWIGGDKDGYRSTLESIANEYGYACAAVNYRYISETVDLNDIMDDIELAVKCIKEKGAENGTNINRMLLTGGSAGGHLSLLYGYSRCDTSAIPPAAVVSDCGPTDLTDDNYYINNALGDEEYVAKILSWACGQPFTYETRAEAAEALERVSPLYYAAADTVPTVINHGMKDDIVPFSNAQALDKKLSELGVKHVFNIYPNSGHGLSEDPENMRIAKELLYEYMATYIG